MAMRSLNSVDINNRKAPAQPVRVNFDAITFAERRVSTDQTYTVVHFMGGSSLCVEEALHDIL